VKRWSGPGDRSAVLAEVDLKVGGRYRIHMQAPDGSVAKVSGVYQVVDPPHRLVYTWAWETWPEAGETLVTVEFRDHGAETEIALVHERFPNEDVRGAHDKGWTGALHKLGTMFPGA
jgi:uncharacterized protein YndB with AHSA1/START domain